MCLLLTRPRGAPVVHEEWLRDFYSRNKDGFGIMHSDGHNMFVDKKLGSVNDFIEMWRKYEGQDVPFAAHLRMRTHGDIDLENCHPYQVLSPDTGAEIWMMHNGVLSNGNNADTTKSDTWHFIKDYLRPLLDPMQGGDPDLPFKPQFKSILGAAVGNSNKFVFMNHAGLISTINKSAGMEWNGIWFSNTYAWGGFSSMKADAMPTKYTYQTGGYEGYDTGPTNGNRNRIYSGVAWIGGKKGEYIAGKWWADDDPERPKTGATTTKKEKPLALVERPKEGSSGKRSAPTVENATDERGRLSDETMAVVGIFKAIKDAGFKEAHNLLTFNSIGKFIKHFDVQDALDLIELAIAELIDEEQLTLSFTNYKLAKELLVEGAEAFEGVLTGTTVTEAVELDDAKEATEKRRKTEEDLARLRAQEAEQNKIIDEAWERAKANYAAKHAGKDTRSYEEWVSAVEANRVAEAAKKADAALDKASESAQLQLQLKDAAPPQAETTKETEAMKTKLSDLAASLEEPVSEEAVATDVHLAESEAAAQVAGQPHSGAE